MTNTINNVPRELLERAAYTLELAYEVDTPTVRDIRALLSAPSPAGVDGLDERMKAAGMFSAAELIAGAPLDAFMKHAGVNDMDTYGQWLEMRRGECLRMKGRYDLGERDKTDDMYEWTIAHSAVFGEAHVNFKAALAGNKAITDGLRGELRSLEEYAAGRMNKMLDQRDQLAGLLRECCSEFDTSEASAFEIDMRQRIDAALAELKP